MRIAAAVVVLLALGVAGASAGSWSCSDHVETVLKQAYLVVSVCRATGTYTTGGDPITGRGLCGSIHRFPELALLSAAGLGATGAFVAIWNPGTSRVVLATTGTGRNAPLPEVDPGTSIADFAFQAITICR